MSRIIFYHNPRSRAAIVHWMLEEAGADYEVRPVDFAKGEHKSAEFLSINPMGKLPTIVVDGTAITETPAIIAWLADACPAAKLAPPVGSAAGLPAGASGGFSRQPLTTIPVQGTRTVSTASGSRSG